MNKKVMSALLGIIGISLGGNAAPKPNIIFLMSDDQSTYSVGCYGNKDVKTPNMDQLGADGMIFERHYATSSICMASRANVMTGMYEYKTGTNFGHGNMKPEVWAKSYPILLRESGYLTAFAGKFGFIVDGKGICEQDFDIYAGAKGQSSYITKKNKALAKYAKEYPHSTLAYGAFGGDVIKDAVAQRKPFCLSISFKAPHKPADPDPRFNDVYAGVSFTKPGNFGREFADHLAPQSKTGRQWERFTEWHYDTNYDGVMRLYYQQIYGIDVALGMIREALEAQGVADNTIIIYTSDNGYICGSHGYGSKVIPLEESSRVPLMIYDPRVAGKAAQNRTSELTGNIDIAPTILSLAGLPIPKNMDGKNLLPILETPTAGGHEALSLFCGYSGNFLTVVTPDYKYTYWPAKKEMPAFEELFELEKDPMEKVNLAQNPEYAPMLEKARKGYQGNLALFKADVIDYNGYAHYPVTLDPNATEAEKRSAVRAPRSEKAGKTKKNKVKKGKNNAE